MFNKMSFLNKNINTFENIVTPKDDLKYVKIIKYYTHIFFVEMVKKQKKIFFCRL